MKLRHAILPFVAAAAVCTAASTASAKSYFNYNWGSFHANSNSQHSFWSWGDSDESCLRDIIEDCDFNWDDCDYNGYFSFKKNDCEVTRVDCDDIDEYVCRDNNSWFHHFNGFKLSDCKWGRSWDFDCIEYVPCEETPPQCNTVPTPAAAGAGLGLMGLLGAGRTLRRRNSEEAVQD